MFINSFNKDVDDWITNLSTPNGLSGVGVGFGEDGDRSSLLKFEPSSSSPMFFKLFKIIKRVFARK